MSHEQPKIPSLPEQYALIRELQQKPLVPGESWFVIARTWFKRWEAACLDHCEKYGIDARNLKPIDNSAIVSLAYGVDGAYELEAKSPALRGYNIELVPQDAHALLVEWLVTSANGGLETLKSAGSTRYGPEQPTVERQVVKQGGWTGIELYPLWLRLYNTQVPTARPFYVCISYADTLGTLMRAIDQHYPRLQNVSRNVARLKTRRAWRGHECLDELDVATSGGTISVIEDSVASDLSQSLAEALILLHDTIIVEDAVVASADIPKLTTASPSSRPSRAGARGLINLGHTCFMNSALQCLGHVSQLYPYLLDGSFENDINTTNIFGSHGALTSAFAEVLKGLFNQDPKEGPLEPRKFRYQIGQLAPDLGTAYQEQDSQELLVFLLDGLHEDLNRIEKKPFVEMPEWYGGGGKEIVELASAFREASKLRDDSKITDVFQGQFRSTISCPSCSKRSITFENFMFLSLPIPQSQVWRHQVVFVPWSTKEHCSKVELTLWSADRIVSLKHALARQFSALSDNLLVTEVFANKWYKILPDWDEVTTVRQTDRIVVYELPVPISSDTAGRFLPVFSHLNTAIPDAASIKFDMPASHPPFLIYLDDAKGPLTASDLRQMIANRYNQWRIFETTLSSTEFPLSVHLTTHPNGAAPTSDQTRFELRPGLPLPFPETEKRAYGEMSSSSVDSRIELESLSSIVVSVEGNPSTHTPSPFGSLLDAEAPASMDPAPLRNNQNPSVPLHRCLTDFVAPEVLGEENAWFCSQCAMFRPEAYKQIEIWEPPEVLIVHLKRFGSASRKINNAVDYPVTNLDITPWVVSANYRTDAAPAQRRYVYDLRSVSEHDGEDVGTGAYTAHALNAADNTWYHFDDAKVNPSNAENAMSKNAYMLIYERKR